MRWGALILLLVAVLSGLTQAQPATPQERLEANRHTLVAVAAQSYLNQCLYALHEMKATGKLDRSWDGKSCTDPALGLPPEPAVTDSVIQLFPDTPAGFSVTVQSVTGPQYQWPEEVPVSAIAPALRLLLTLAVLTLATAAFGWLFFKFVFSLIDNSILISGLAVTGLMCGGLTAGALAWWWQAWGSELAPIPTLLIVGVSGGLAMALPRLLHWDGREPWWISIGLAQMFCWALLPVCWYLLALFSGMTSTLDERLPDWVLATWGTVHLLVLWMAWTRRRDRPKLHS